MKRVGDIRALKQVAAIRAVQKAAAEADAAGAAANLHAREESQRASEAERDAAVAGWSASLQAAHIVPELAYVWSRALREREHDAHRSQASVERAHEDRRESAGKLNRAARLCDAADDRMRGALRARARKQSERALADALDRHVQRWSAR